MTKLISAFRNFAKGLKNRSLLSVFTVSLSPFTILATMMISSDEMLQDCPRNYIEIGHDY
jgi:hypothetical protein